MASEEHSDILLWLKALQQGTASRSVQKLLPAAGDIRAYRGWLSTVRYVWLA
jgi:hypothetical protein